MGHKTGTGLGRHSQGRVEIIESSVQKGRRGLGAAVSGFETKNLDWKFENEEVKCLFCYKIIGLIQYYR